MDITLSYNRIKELIPFATTYLYICRLRYRLLDKLIIFYVVLSLLFYPYVSRIIGNEYLLFLYFCILLLFSMNFVFAYVFYKKFNNTIIHIDFDKDNVILKNQKCFHIDRKNSMVIKHSNVVLIIHILAKVKFAIPITANSCNELTMNRIITYISTT